MTDPDEAPEQIERWVSNGANHGAIVKLLVASGGWTEVGAEEMVASLTAADEVTAAPLTELGWPGPFEEGAPPLFTS